ncbi:pyridoxamine 5'-phosphate oxidase [Pleomassaria siparia CBS 279.74]|uniref:pyridoxal 5'-phosphate synthase n=1 Tax=Pleomassaria siparia CBS 279.74 TaxID=1314801 RepID=A0A6G1K8U0_9PLEO|nr:pyridoxamine 5'-phosphate oxidase [Pleomassaria siparia CBS 279.74]
MLIHQAAKTFRLTSSKATNYPRLSHSILETFPSASHPKPFTMLHSAKNHNMSPDQLSSQKPKAYTSESTASKLIFAPTGGSDDPTKAVQYEQGKLDLSDLSPSPLAQFHAWFSAAQEAKVYQPETVTFATAELPSGKVSARVVFMKELDERGFVIYSNWDTSRKAADVKSNPYASLTFWWREMERQVRVEGRTERLTDEESQVYYDTRARGSRIGAWASPQSKVLEGREELEKRVEEVEKKWEGKDKIAVPSFWGGIRVIPELVEFWQGRESRLHDRFRFTKKEGADGGEWKIERLGP